MNDAIDTKKEQEGSSAIELIQSGTLTPKQDTELFLARANEHIQKRKGLVKLIAANVNPKDVVIYGNDPEKMTVHYAKDACKQILGWIEADIEDLKITESRYDGKAGPYAIFEAHGTLVLPGGRRISVVGSRATFDDFFGSASRYEDGKKISYQKPMEEVDIPSVRLAAITNMWNHALEDAGLKPSLAELKEAGLDLSKASYVTFKQPAGAPTNTPAGAPTPQQQQPSPGQGEAIITEAQGKRLYAIAKGAGWQDNEMKAFLKRKFGLDHTRDIPRSKYEEVVAAFESGTAGMFA